MNFVCGEECRSVRKFSMNVTLKHLPSFAHRGISIVSGKSKPVSQALNCLQALNPFIIYI